MTNHPCLFCKESLRHIPKQYPNGQQNCLLIPGQPSDPPAPGLSETYAKGRPREVTARTSITSVLSPQNQGLQLIPPETFRARPRGDTLCTVLGTG